MDRQYKHTTEKVILVDQNNQQIGIEEKIKAHQENKLHRAFSIFVFNSIGELLIQQRAKTKYHSTGLWTNTCCSHPQPGQSLNKAVHGRLLVEMGFDCHLVKLFDYRYQTKLDNDLYEHEYDFVYGGLYDGEPIPNQDEVEDYQWIDIRLLKNEINREPSKYTYWFKVMIDQVIRISFQRGLIKID